MIVLETSLFEISWQVAITNFSEEKFLNGEHANILVMCCYINFVSEEFFSFKDSFFKPIFQRINPYNSAKPKLSHNNIIMQATKKPSERPPCCDSILLLHVFLYKYAAATVAAASEMTSPAVHSLTNIACLAYFLQQSIYVLQNV